MELPAHDGVLGIANRLQRADAIRSRAGFVLLTMAVCLCASPAVAARLTKGSTVLWLGLNGNDAQLLDPSGGGSGCWLSGSLFAVAPMGKGDGSGA